MQQGIYNKWWWPTQIKGPDTWNGKSDKFHAGKKRKTRLVYGRIMGGGGIDSEGELLECQAEASFIGNLHSVLNCRTQPTVAYITMFHNFWKYFMMTAGWKYFLMAWKVTFQNLSSLFHTIMLWQSQERLSGFLPRGGVTWHGPQQTLSIPDRNQRIETDLGAHKVWPHLMNLTNSAFWWLLRT